MLLFVFLSAFFPEAAEKIHKRIDRAERVLFVFTTGVVEAVFGTLWFIFFGVLWAVMALIYIGAMWLCNLISWKKKKGGSSV